MKYTLFFMSLIFLFGYTGCSSPNDKTSKKNNKVANEVKVTYAFENDDHTKIIMSKGSRIAKLATIMLGEALNKSIKEEGLENAIDFCNQNAMTITDSLAKAENVTIQRLAKKNRNPLNEMDAVESKIYKQYVLEWLSNETLKAKVAINNYGNPVFYKPIIINKKCLTCHGIEGKTMPEKVAEKISKLYPEDKAIDFKNGHPRGMWAITFKGVTVSK